MSSPGRIAKFRWWGRARRAQNLFESRTMSSMLPRKTARMLSIEWHCHLLSLNYLISVFVLSFFFLFLASFWVFEPIGFETGSKLNLHCHCIELGLGLPGVYTIKAEQGVMFHSGSLCFRPNVNWEEAASLGSAFYSVYMCIYNYIYNYIYICHYMCI